MLTETGHLAQLQHSLPKRAGMLLGNFSHGQTAAFSNSFCISQTKRFSRK